MLICYKIEVRKLSRRMALKQIEISIIELYLMQLFFEGTAL